MGAFTLNIPSVNSDLGEMIVSSQSELMKNYQAANPISSDHEISAVQDDKGNPMIFSLGTDGDFHLIAQDYDIQSPTGWVQINLNNSLKGLGKPVSVVARQLPDNSITVAVVVADEKESNQHHVFIASRLSNRLSNKKINEVWQKLENYDLWQKWKNPELTKINSVFISPMSDSDDRGAIKSDPFIAVSVAVTDTAQIDNYILRSTLNAEGQVVSWSNVAFPFPTDSKQVLDFALGNIQDLGSGLYMLYTGKDGDAQLKFKTFSNEYGRDYVRSFAVPEGAISLQTSSGKEGTTRLFVAGKDGIHLFSPNNQAPNAVPKQIANSNDISTVSPNGLSVTEDPNNEWLTVWVLCGERLMHFHNGNPDGVWSMPLVFKQGVSQFAPIRNHVYNSNEIVYIEAIGEQVSNVQWMTQDPKSTSWRTNMIPVFSEGKTIEYNTYTSHINIQNKQGIPVFNQSFQLDSSERCKVIVNGRTHIVSPQNPITVQPDLLGNLTVISQAKDLTSPVFTIESSSLFEGSIQINPAHGVYAKLETVADKGVDSLPGHITSKLNEQSQKSLVEGITELTELKLGSNQALQYLNNSKRSAKRAAAPQIPNQRWGMTFDEGELQFDTGAATSISRIMDAPMSRMASAQRSIFTEFDSWVGDIWQHIETVLDEVKSFVIDVVDGVVHFIVEIGEQFLKFVIEVANDVFRVLNLILEKLKLVFDEVLEWLGSIFEWDDILDTSKVISNMAKESLNFANYKIDGLKDVVEDFFEDKKEVISTFVIPDQLKGHSVVGGANQAIAAHTKDEVIERKVAGFAASPRGNFAIYHVMHGGMIRGKSEKHAPSSPLEAIFDELLKPTFLSLKGTVTKLGKDIDLILESNDIPAEDLFSLVAGDFLIGILDALEKIAIGILDVLKSVVNLVKKLMTDEIQIPFLKSFFNRITKGQEFNVLNGICLLLAVPVTAIYKIIHKEAIFENGTYGLENAGFREIFAFFGSPLEENNKRSRIAIHDIELSLATERMAQAYDFISGIIYGVSTLISGLLSIAASYFDEPGKEIKAGFLSRLSVAFELLKFGFSIPLIRGNVKAQIFEYADWGVKGFALFRKTLEAFLTKNPILDTVLGIWLVVEGVASMVLQLIVEGFYLDDPEEKDRMYIHIIKLFEAILGGGSDVLSGSSQATPPVDATTVATIEALKYGGIGLTVVGVFISVSRVTVEQLQKI